MNAAGKQVLQSRLEEDIGVNWLERRSFIQALVGFRGDGEIERAQIILELSEFGGANARRGNSALSDHPIKRHLRVRSPQFAGHAGECVLRLEALERRFERPVNVLAAVASGVGIASVGLKVNLVARTTWSRRPRSLMISSLPELVAIGHIQEVTAGLQVAVEDARASLSSLPIPIRFQRSWCRDTMG